MLSNPRGVLAAVYQHGRQERDYMTMLKHTLTSILAFGFALAASGQRSAPPPAERGDDGPTLPATMRFIQEKLIEEGKVGWLETFPQKPGTALRAVLAPADSMADPGTCTLYVTSTIDTVVELPKGTVFKPGFTAEDFHSRIVETDTILLKLIEKVAVKSLQDIRNEQYAQAGRPDLAVTITPALFSVRMSAATAVFLNHSFTTKGNQAPVEKEVAEKTNSYVFHDEETANHFAKAVNHAVELCGGGAKKDIF